MIFHVRTEIPEPCSKHLDCESLSLTDEEGRILKTQIRKNNGLIGDYIHRLDLFLNQERYPQNAVFIQKMRRRLDLLIEENDTFRKVLWKNEQTSKLTVRGSEPYEQ